MKENLRKIESDKNLIAQKRNYFLGRVYLHDVSKKIGVKDQKVYLVAFKHGARTKLHYHEGGQLLFVTEGKGMLVLYKKTSTKYDRIKIRPSSKFRLKMGDIVYIPKYTLHWHGGALKRGNFIHIAFNAFTKKGKKAGTIWYESNFMSYCTKMV